MNTNYSVALQGLPCDLPTVAMRCCAHGISFSQRSALLSRNCSAPQPAQPLHRTELAHTHTHHAKVSSFVRPMKQYASTTFCEPPVCKTQPKGSALLPRNCSATSATLASNKACAHAPCQDVILRTYREAICFNKLLRVSNVCDTQHSCSALLPHNCSAPQPAQPLHRTKLARTHHAQDVVLRADRTAICFNNFLRRSNVCNAQRSRSALLPRNCSAPQPAQPLHRTKLAHMHHAKVSSCMQTAQLYASTPFCARAMFAIHSGGAQRPHSCSAPQPAQPLHLTKLAHTHQAKMSSCVQTAKL